MLEIGDIVLCINNHNASALMINGKYIVTSLNETNQAVWVKSFDGNVVITAFEYRFVKITDYRRNKIKKICSKLEMK